MTPTELRKLRKGLLHRVTRACFDYQLLEPGDRVMVAVSGGKDSLTMLNLLDVIRRRAPFDFELVAVTLDQGQPGFPVERLEAWYAEQGYTYRILRADTYSVVTAKLNPGDTYCSLCSRLRRGILYSAAVEMGCTKIALGHHRDDVIETLLLNLFFTGQLKAMPARLHSDDGRNVVIRPLVYCEEAEIARYAEAMHFPILPCNLCGSQPNLQRQRIKELLATLERDIPQIRQSMMAALQHVRPTHLFSRPLLERAGVLEVHEEYLARVGAKAPAKPPRAGRPVDEAPRRAAAEPSAA